MAEKPIDYTMEEKTEANETSDDETDAEEVDVPMDLSASVELPMDLTTTSKPKRKLAFHPRQLPDAMFSVSSGAVKVTMETESRPSQFPLSFDCRPMGVPGSQSSPPLEACLRFNGMGGSSAKLASPLTSPTLNSPPSHSCTTSADFHRRPSGHRTSPSDFHEFSPRQQLTSPSLPSLGLDSSPEKDEQENSKLHTSRLFNVLAKALVGDIDCPPRPGHSKGSNATAGGAAKRDCTESDAEYRERRGKNNLAARRSRDKRKIKCEVILAKTQEFKKESTALLNEIRSIQEMLIIRGYSHPLPFSEEINFYHDELCTYS